MLSNLVAIIMATVCLGVVLWLSSRWKPREDDEDHDPEA